MRIAHHPSEFRELKLEAYKSWPSVTLQVGYRTCKKQWTMVSDRFPVFSDRRDPSRGIELSRECTVIQIEGGINHGRNFAISWAALQS
jgi:hypothetical protein